jgi:hypothetical protein
MSNQEETVDRMEERLREIARQVWRELLEPLLGASAGPARQGRRRSTAHSRRLQADGDARDAI